LANYLGTGLGVVLGLVAVPFYLRFLGPEGWGLVGFFASLQALLTFLDLGLSVSVNREISRLSRERDSAWARACTIRTFEWIYYGMGLVIFLFFCLGAGWLASGFINSQTFTHEEVTNNLILAGAALALRWPNALYAGVLRGMERQVLLNVLGSILNISRTVSTLAVLAFYSPAVDVFFQWQLIFAVIELAVTAFVAWRASPGPPAASFKKEIIQRLWKFSLGVAAASLCAALLKQVDRLMVAKLLPLDDLAFYSTAVTVGMALTALFGPIHIAWFPRLTKLVGQPAELARLFHLGCRLVGVLVAPAGAALVFFSHDILYLWTGSEPLANAAASSLSWTALAMLLNASLTIPQALALAHGMSFLPFATNLTGIIILVPLTWIFVNSFGITGAAISWAIFNLGYFVAFPLFLLPKVLQGHYFSWLFYDVLPFLFAALVLFSALQFFLPPITNLPILAGVMAGGGLLYLSGGLMLDPILRKTSQRVCQASLPYFQKIFQHMN
jgi:O-antigen/teichoic acid export membrane protein